MSLNYLRNGDLFEVFKLFLFSIQRSGIFKVLFDPCGVSYVGQLG